MKAIDKPNISFRFTASNERVKGMIDAVLVVRYKRRYVPVKLPIRIHMCHLAKNRTNTYRMVCNGYNLYEAYKEYLNEIVSAFNECNLEFDAYVLAQELKCVDINWQESRFRQYVDVYGRLIN